MRRLLLLLILCFFASGCSLEADPAPSADGPLPPGDVGEPPIDGVEVTESGGEVALYDGASPTLDGYVGPGTDTIVAIPDASIGAQPLGGVCAFDEGCTDGSCNTAYSGGYCTRWCTTDVDCPEGGKCYEDPKTGDKMCWKLCSTPLGCRADQFCAEGVGICTPKCEAGACDNNYICDESSGQCLPPGTSQCEPTTEIADDLDNDCDGVTDEGFGPQLSENEFVLAEDLGQIVVGGGGLSKKIRFEAQAADEAVTILVIDHEASADLMAIYNLTSPSGELLANASAPFDSPIVTYPDLSVLTVQVPNTPSVALETGQYEFTVYRDGDLGTAWIYVLHSVRPDPSWSELDVNYWFVATPGYSALNAMNKQKFKSLHNTFKALMKSHGVLLGNVYTFDITGNNATKYTYVDTGGEGYEVDEHSELVALSAGLPPENKGVNFFFVQGFNGWGLLGKAGGIPGPPLLHGTHGSGVVVSLTDFYDYPSNIGIPITAETMGHELGHQLGLFHTSEQTGEYHDPIDDTAECTSDWNDDGVVSFEECEGKGADNLMFWSITLSSKLTPGQKFVIHRNASMY
jgi:hypothetical protein